MNEQRVGMKPGESFKIRLLPREIMVCVAVVKQVVPEAKNLSLAQVVRIGLTELCEAAVRAGAVPEPNEFDYEQTIADYRRGVVARKQYLHTTVTTGRMVMQEQMRRVSAGGTAAFGGLSLGERERELTDEGSKVAARLRRDLVAGQGKRIDPRTLRRNELKFRSEQDPANMSAAEFKELRKLQKELAHA